MRNIIKKEKLRFVIFNLCLILIIIISGLVFFAGDLTIDWLVYEFFVNNFSSKSMDSFMIGVTKLGNTNFVVLFSSLIFVFICFFRRERVLSLIFIGSVVIGSGLNHFMKILFKRERPEINRLIEIGGYSFPSGHAMISLILYGLLAYIIYKSVNTKWVRNVIVGVIVILILLIGISRIYLGVHYFSDIVVGFLISVIFLVFVTSILDKKVFSHN